MSFHPSKCLAMHISSKKRPFKTYYTNHGQTLQTVDSTKQLSVHLDKCLNWKTHVDTITKKKANNMCSFLHRNLRKCSVETKDMAYRSLEYSSPVWDSATKSESDKIEKVQRKEARFVCNDYRRTSSVTTNKKKRQIICAPFCIGISGNAQ